MRRKNDVSTLRYARTFERLQLRTSGFNRKYSTKMLIIELFKYFINYLGVKKEEKAENQERERQSKTNER